MQLDMRVNGTTKLTGLIGNPVEHTVSPMLHNSLFNSVGINGIYVPLKVPEGNLKEAVRGLKANGFAGFNITIPYKEAILDCVDEISDEVRQLGAANTVKILNGKLFAYNTDTYGFEHSFKEHTRSELKNKSVCILGAGGTAKAIAVKTALEGAARIDIINRTEVKANDLAANVNNVLNNKMSSGKTAFAAASGSTEALNMLKEADVVINTTSVGMFPNVSCSPLQNDFVFQKKQIVYDVIYNPQCTKLLSDAQACGCKAVNGAGMLFYQGVKAFEIFMDIEVPIKTSDDLLREFLKYLGA